MKNNMSPEGKIEITEGHTLTIFKETQQQLGGEIYRDGNSYRLDDRATGKINLDCIYLGDDVEVTLHDLDLKQMRQFHRKKGTSSKYVYILILINGGLTQTVGSKTLNIGSESNNGMFIYNGNFTVNLDIEPGKPIYALRYRVNIERKGGHYTDTKNILRSMFGNDSEGIYFHHAMPNGVMSLAKDLFLYNKQENHRNIKIAYRGMEIFIRTMEAIEKHQLDESYHLFHNDELTRLNEIKNLIVEDISTRFTLKELAERFNSSESKLKRDFKSRYGISIVQFSNKARMNEALHRLQSGEYSVKEVGYDLGYSNLSKFSAMFQKMNGLKPSEVIAGLSKAKQ